MAGNTNTAIQKLQNAGANVNNEDLQRLHFIARSAIFFPVSTALTPSTFFSNSNMNTAYQNMVFPYSANAYEIRGIEINTDIQFNLTSPILQSQWLNQFIKGSYLTIKVNSQDRADFCLDVLTPFDLIPATPGTQAATPVAADQQLQVRNKYTNWFPLDVPIVIPAGIQAEIKLNPANLTTSAAVATINPSWANNGLSAAASFGVFIRLNGYNLIPATI